MKSDTSMSAELSGYLIIFGILIGLLGVITYQTHPDNAKTALIFGSSFGALSVFWGILGAKGVGWSRFAALITAVFLGLACLWRAGIGWLAVVNGQVDRLFASVVITLMLVVSGIMVWWVSRDQSSHADKNTPRT